MALDVGTRLGPYEIVAPLGAGGMGEVYRAVDTRLDRTVAIKVLAAHLAADPDLRERFEREARAISALNHPHICGLFDVGDASVDTPDGPASVRFLVLEYLEGETLAARLAKGALPFDQTIRIALQVADAVDKAHRAGVVHRDLKPSNVVLTKSGAKLVDFGLAKMRPRAGVVTDATMGATALVTAPHDLTTRGTILGTLQYMAPEQLEGHDADARTDIFAFGAMLHEMLTGRKAFEAKTQTSLLVAILEHEPPAMTDLQPLATPALQHLVSHCLAKDPDRRWQNMADVMLALTDAASVAQTATTSSAVPQSRRALAMAALLAVAVVAAAATAVIWSRRGADAGTASIRFAVEPPPNFTFNSGSNFQALSPDGRWLALLGSKDDNPSQIWLRALDSLDIQPLPRTEGGLRMFWAPDSRSVAFFQNGKLRRVGIDGGTPITICEAGSAVAGQVSAGGAWGPGDVMLFAGQEGLKKVPAGGGEPTVVTTLDRTRGDTGHGFPAFLSDGRHFLFRVESSNAARSGVYIGSIDGDAPVRLLATDSTALYAPPGFVLFAKEGNLFAQPFDARRLRLGGESTVVAPEIQTGPPLNRMNVSLSTTGLLAFRQRVTPKSALRWFAANGDAGATIGDAGPIRKVNISPDGARVVVSRGLGVDTEIWTADLTQGLFSRVTPGSDPVWMPDGRTLIIARSTPEAAIFRVASGQADAEVLAGTSYPRDVSRDGRWLLVTSSPHDLNLVDLEKQQPQIRLAQLSPAVGHYDSQFSPDGKWICYTAQSAPGETSVYVMRMPPTAERWQIATHSALARWRADGSGLVYVSGGRTVMAADVTPDFPKVVRARRLFDAPGTILDYALAADGRMLLDIAPGDAITQPLTIVSNWSSAIKQ